MALTHLHLSPCKSVSFMLAASFTVAERSRQQGFLHTSQIELPAKMQPFTGRLVLDSGRRGLLKAAQESKCRFDVWGACSVFRRRKSSPLKERDENPIHRKTAKPSKPFKAQSSTIPPQNLKPKNPPSVVHPSKSHFARTPPNLET